jgi:putative transposase
VRGINFQFDQTMDGLSVKFLNVIDEFSRVCLATRVSRRCQAVDVIDTIEELLKLYPPLTHLRMDNGSEVIAHALQEWCTGGGAGTAFIEPGSPWENPFAESFNGRLRDEFLNLEHFSKVQEGRLLAEWHQIEYNTNRLFEDLQGHTPLEILKQWRAA